MTITSRRHPTRRGLLRAGLIGCLAWLAPSPRAQLPPIPSNEEVGIDVDRFVGHPDRSPAIITHKVMIKRSILRGGDPYNVGEPGAVLQYRKELATAILMARNQTPLIDLPDQQLFYIESGQGRVDDGKHYWNLKNGVGVLVPPGVKHRLTNTSDEPVKMLMVTWQPDADVTPLEEIRVRDIDQLPFTGAAHWGAYMGKNLFNGNDGLHPGEGFHIVHVAPMMIGDPHAHTPGWEEVWTKLPPYDANMLLGSEIREMPVHTGFLSPPNGKTAHAVMNLKKDTIQQWFFIGRFTSRPAKYPEWPIVEPRSLKNLK